MASESNDIAIEAIMKNFAAASTLFFESNIMNTEGRLASSRPINMVIRELDIESIYIPANANTESIAKSP